MFTGIITDIGEIIDLKVAETSIYYIKTNYNTKELNIGTSIACDGCCLTVVETGNNYFKVDVSPETKLKTNLKFRKIGDKINLERSLKVGDELAGHFVLGHVDTTTKIHNIIKQEQTYILEFIIPDDYKKYIVGKGSITINGISLTVNDVKEKIFTVTIIPHTWEKTNLQFYKIGDLVNIEIDALARYILGSLDRT